MKRTNVNAMILSTLVQCVLSLVCISKNQVKLRILSERLGTEIAIFECTFIRDCQHVQLECRRSYDEIYQHTKFIN